MEKTVALEINPGGEAAIWRIGKDEADDLGRDRLIFPEEMLARGYKSCKTSDTLAGGAIVACEDCNNKLAGK